MWLSFAEQRDIAAAPLFGDELDADFVSDFGAPAALWLPSADNPGLASDFSGNNIVGALNGGVTVVPGGAGVFSSAWQFDGTTGKLIYPRPSQITYTSPWTVAIVAKFNGVPALENMVTIGDGSRQIFTAYWWNSGNGLIFSTVNVNQCSTLSVDPDITKWHLWCFTCPNANFQNANVYVDGVDLTHVDSNVLAAVPDDQFALSVGQSHNFQSSMSVACVFAWAVQLIPAQVSALYSSLLYGEPYRLFAPSVMERFYGAGSSVATVMERRTISQFGTRTGSRQAA